MKNTNSVQSIQEYTNSPRPIQQYNDRKEVSIAVDGLESRTGMNGLEVKENGNGAGILKSASKEDSLRLIEEAISHEKEKHDDKDDADKKKKKKEKWEDIKVYITFALLTLLTVSIVVCKVVVVDQILVSEFPTERTLHQETRSNIMYTGGGFINYHPDFISNDYPVDEDAFPEIDDPNTE